MIMDMKMGKGVPDEQKVVEIWPDEGEGISSKKADSRRMATLRQNRSRLRDDKI
jgi:hypothetical protein